MSNVIIFSKIRQFGIIKITKFYLGFENVSSTSLDLYFEFINRKFKNLFCFIVLFKSSKINVMNVP